MKGGEPLVDRRQGGCRVVAVAEFADGARALGLLAPDGLARLRAAHAGPAGRAGTSVVPLPDGSARLHVRPVRRGGWLGRLGGAELVSFERPLAELRVTARLARAGAPVPQPAWVAGRRRTGGPWTVAIATVFVEGACDGAVWLSRAPARSRVFDAARAAGAAVRRLHAVGARHPDLHVRNLLFRDTGAALEVLVADWDRAALGEPPSARERMAELARLYRSLFKLRLLDGVGPEGCAHFLDAYTGGDRSLQRSLVAHLPRERARLAVHALGYGR